jgi:hypothetical protein
MPNKPYPADILTQAQSVLEAWKQINPDLTLGELTQAALAGELSDASPLLAQIDALETQLTNLRNQRDALFASMWDKVKRVRSGVKAIYGDDSSQYEMVGGTRASERKAPVRKAKA